MNLRKGSAQKRAPGIHSVARENPWSGNDRAGSSSGVGVQRVGGRIPRPDRADFLRGRRIRHYNPGVRLGVVLESFFFIGFAALTVGGGAVVMLSRGGRSLAAGWALTCGSLAALTLFYPGPWLLSLVFFGLAAAGLMALPKVTEGTPPGFAPGEIRRSLAILSVWAISLLLLRASHGSPALASTAVTAGSPLYWMLYSSAALFGLGLLTLILKKSIAQGWCGVGLLLLSPLPSALASTQRPGTGDGWLLALLCGGFCLVHGAVAYYTLGQFRRLNPTLDSQAWEELQG
jgi:hypothetical protein